MTNVRVAPSRHWVDGGDKVDHTIAMTCQLLSPPSTHTTNDVSPTVAAAQHAARFGMNGALYTDQRLTI